MENIVSYYKLLFINIQRGFDHLYRTLTGLPTLRRSMVTPELYLGGQYNHAGFTRLRKLGITGIVNMRTHSIHKDMQGITDVRILNLPTPDQKAPSLESLKKGVVFMKNEIDNGGKVYVHCHWGEGRGPSMAIAYLISTGLTFADAMALVKMVRTFIKPTQSQIERLREFEEEVHKSN